MRNTFPTRRRFLGQMGCAGLNSIPLLNTLLNLQLAGSIANAAPPTPGEYRALVCLFLSGGNDSFNLLAPHSGASSTHGDSFVEYQTSRGNLALAKPGFHQIHPENTPGRTFGVHPSMPNLAARFEAGDAAFLSNVGTLIEPVQNRSQVAALSKLLPLGLYSHSDQIEQWQTSVPHSRTGIGWAGRMMDLIQDINPGQAVSMNISMDGSNVFQSGQSGAEYSVNPGNANQPEGGAVALTGYQKHYDPNNNFANAASTAMDGMLAQEYGHLFQETWQAKRRTAQEAYELYSSATAGTMPGNVSFPNTSLGRQLRQVAKTIMGRATLGAQRQTFFVNRGGWDHHSDTILLQQSMLGEVDAALGAFWDQLTALGIANNVTLFSASDFGRTLTSNNRGSDHAWGGNHFVIGGSVVGKNLYGQYPSLAINPEAGAEINALDTGRGRLIPTTSCDEYFAELALWLGVPPSSLPVILPNIGNFYSSSSGNPPLGFLA